MRIHALFFGFISVYATGQSEFLFQRNYVYSLSDAALPIIDIPSTISGAFGFLNSALTVALPTLTSLGFDFALNPNVSELCVGSFTNQFDPPFLPRSQQISTIKLGSLNCLVAQPGKEVMSSKWFESRYVGQCPLLIPSGGDLPVVSVRPVQFPSFIVKWNNDSTHSVMRVQFSIEVQGVDFTQIYVGEVAYGPFQGSRIIQVAQNNPVPDNIVNLLCALGIPISSNQQVAVFAILA